MTNAIRHADNDNEAASALAVLVAGATGLVGRAIVGGLCTAPQVARVIAIARRPLGVTDPKLEVREVDFSRLDDEAPAVADAACCALGTTIAAAGSQEAFRRVDFEYTMAFARFALKSGARRFALVSSVGADPGAKNFYLRVKGEVEQALRALPFEGLAILRPGLLLGAREEWRPAEAFARAVAPWLNPLLLGPLAQYRSVHAEQVAEAAIATVTGGDRGVTLLDVPAIERRAQTSRRSGTGAATTRE